MLKDGIFLSGIGLICCFVFQRRAYLNMLGEDKHYGNDKQKQKRKERKIMFDDIAADLESPI